MNRSTHWTNWFARNISEIIITAFQANGLMRVNTIKTAIYVTLYHFKSDRSLDSKLVV